MGSFDAYNTFQTSEEAKHMFQNLFNPNIEFIESTYSIQIDKKTIPTFKPGIIRQFRVNTKQIIKDVLIKKTKKNYPYKENGYSRKGILILGVFDPSFGGFKRDVEFNERSLKNLKMEVYTECVEGSFQKILLVDVLTPFHNDISNRTFELFNAEL
jgi:hypothetical protein